MPGFPEPFVVWCVAFAYATCMALTLQKLILPLLPELHAGHGLLNADAISFHNTAVELAARIHAVGWSEWRLFPAGGAGNVGVLAAIYAVLGPDPAWFVPLNAAAHATGALMLYLIGPLLWPGREGRLGGLIASVLFLVFPSGLMWYGQNHKDAFSIAGTLLIIYAWLSALPGEQQSPKRIKILALIIAGMVLIIVTKPYLLKLLGLGAILAWSGVAVATIFLKRLRADRAMLGFSAFLAFTVTASAFLTQPYILEDSEANTLGAWKWERSSVLPSPLDRQLETLSRIRAGLIGYGLSAKAGSMIDVHLAPSNAIDAMTYMPRALTLGLLAPFPNMWVDRPNLFRLVGALETLVWYLLIPGFLLFLYVKPSRRLLGGLIISGFLLMILAYVNANVGTLYRQRFGALFFFSLCGAIGLAKIIFVLLSVTAVRTEQNPITASDGSIETFGNVSGMTHVASSGAIVLMVSLAGYLGFLIRDLLLIKHFGISVELDAFYSATMIPMFFVAFLALPVGDALTVPFLEAGRKGATAQARLVRSLLSVLTVVLVGTGFILLAVAEEVAGLILGTDDADQIASAALMLRCFMPVLMLCGWTVIGNAVLNARRRSLNSALAQLSVPAMAVALILAFQQTWGAYGAIAGMLAGMLINIGLVMHAVKQEGIRLMPGSFDGLDDLAPVFRNYGLLALAALMAAVSVPINYAFAGLLGTGELSSWAVGSKMLQVITGLAGVGVSAVVLPHLARLVNSNRPVQIQSDLYFMLMCGTWIAMVIGIVVYGFSEPLVVAIFEGGEVTRDQALQLAEILKLGSVQLPFIVSTVLILKLAAVSGAMRHVVMAMGGAWCSMFSSTLSSCRNPEFLALQRQW